MSRAYFYLRIARLMDRTFLFIVLTQSDIFVQLPAGTKSISWHFLAFYGIFWQFLALARTLLMIWLEIFVHLP